MSRAVAALGAVILCACLLTLQLPRITPYQFFNCSPYDGGTQCIGSNNPAYLIVFIFSVAGLVLFSFGLFGRAFILGPLFIFGMLSLTLGLIGVILGYIGFESCGSWLPIGLPASCIVYHPEFFEPAFVLGAVLIAGNALPSRAIANPTNKRTLARFLGVVFVVLGAILSLFGLTVVFTFVSNYVSDYTLFWAQIAIGLLLMPAGIILIAWSFAIRKPE